MMVHCNFIPSFLLLILLPFSIHTQANISYLVNDKVFSSDRPIVYGEEAFLRRIAERTSGQRPPVGLVLSGGSARAFAHIGVLKYLEETGFIPDFIVSSSMGCIVGLLYAAGLSPDQILYVIDQTPISHLFKTAIPLQGGIIDVSAFINTIASYTGRLKLEELPIPIIVVAEDLHTKRQIHVAEGDFLNVMQASFALPVFFAPVAYKEHLLIDGAVANLVPVSVATQYTSEIITVTAFYNNPKWDFKNPVTVLFVAFDIAKSRKGVEEIKKYSPILIRAEVESVSFMSYNLLNETVEAGYRSAKTQVPNDFSFFALDAPSEKVFREGIQKIRLDFDKTINRVLKETNDQHLVYATIPSWNLFPTVKFWRNPGNRMLLRNDIFLGLESRAAAGGFIGSAAAALLWNPQQGKISTAAMLMPTFFYKDPLLLSGSLLLSTVNWRSIDELYAKLHFNSRLTRFFPFPLSFHSLFEYQWMPLNEQTNSILSIWLDISKRYTSGSIIALEPGYRLLQLKNDNVYARFYSMLTLGSLFDVEYRGLGKIALKSDGIVPVFISDQIYSPGRESRWIGNNSLTILFSPKDFHPSFGELFIVQDFKVGVYGELGYFSKLNWGAGLKSSLSLALIGLSKVSLSGFVGYNAFDNNVVWQIFIESP